MSMADLKNETQFIQQAQSGDLDSFNALVLHYQNYIYSITYRIMGEGDGAADMAQEAFITAYRKLAQFRGGNFKAWLARIATNTCYDELRKQQRRPADYLEELSGSERPDGPPVATHEPSPESAAQTSELNQAIQDCITALKPAQRIVLVMVDIQGMSYDEVAAQAGIALGTVKSRLSRARVSVQRCLQSVQELLPDQYRLKDND